MQEIVVKPEKKLSWEEVFLEKNKEPIVGFIKIFSKDSYPGMFLFHVIEALILFVLNKFVKNEILATILFLTTYRVSIFIFQNLPSKVQQYILSDFSEEKLAALNKEQLFKFLSKIHVIIKFLQDTYNSIFVKHDILYLSAGLSFMFGFFIVFRAVQFPILFFTFSLFICLSCAITVFGIDKTNTEPQEDQ